MADTETETWLKKLLVFRAELADLAFSMDRRGRAEAADVAMMAFARIGEICEELQPPGGDSPAMDVDKQNEGRTVSSGT